MRIPFIETLLFLPIQACTRISLLFFLQLMPFFSLQAQETSADTLREDGLVYIYKNGRIYRPEFEVIEGSSYKNCMPRYTGKHRDEVLYPLYRSVFSKERAQELSGTRIIYMIDYDSVKRKVLAICFLWGREENFPLKLKELYALEERMMTWEGFVPDLPTSKEGIVDKPLHYGLTLWFGRLYK